MEKDRSGLYIIKIWDGGWYDMYPDFENNKDEEALNINNGSDSV